MGTSLELAILSRKSCLSESERQDFVALFLGLSEEWFDFEGNSCAPWYYHPEEDWSDDIQNLLAWAYVTLPDNQKPPFALLFETMTRCVEQVAAVKADGFYVRLDYFNIPQRRTRVLYGKKTSAKNRSLLHSLVGTIPSVVFPDMRGESYFHFTSENSTLTEKIKIVIDIAAYNNVDLLVNIFCSLIDRYEKNCSIVAVSRALPHSQYGMDIQTVELSINASEWSSFIAGRILRILFQSLNLSKSTSPLTITMNREVFT